jgi:hypothetical protein
MEEETKDSIALYPCAEIVFFGDVKSLVGALLVDVPCPWYTLSGNCIE